MDFDKGFLLGVALLLAAVSFLMIAKFIGYVLGAAILAFTLHPLHEKLRGWTGDRISAFLMVLLAVAMAIIPLMLAGAALVGDASELAKDVNRTDLVNITEVEQRIYDYTGQRMDVESQVNSALSSFTTITAGGFSQIINLATEIFVGISLMLFLLYYLLKDGEELVEWVREVTPLPHDIQETLQHNLQDTTWAVIKGHVLIALIQGMVGGLGLMLAGVPNYYFWTFVMILLSFIPIIGAFLVWMPASVYLFIIDRPGAAVFLFLYGSVVTGSVDNLLRPIIVDRGAKINPAVVLLGVLGGVYLFGAAGLFIGPVIFGIFKATLNVFKNNYGSE